MTYQAQRKDKLSNELSTSVTATTTTTNTEPGVLADPHDLELIRQAYFEVLGPINVVKANVIERALMNGVKPDAILNAITETGMAPRPSHAYLTAILTRYMMMGITDMNAILAERAERDQARREANASKWAWYSDPQGIY